MTEELIFYADKIMVMGNSKNSSVFNLVILLKSQKFDAREIYMFYSIPRRLLDFWSIPRRFPDDRQTSRHLPVFRDRRSLRS